MAGGGDAEAFEDLAGARLEGVAVVVEDQVFELGVAVAVEILVGVGQQLFFFLHGLPELLVAHHDDVENREGLVFEVVLLEHAQPQLLGHVEDPFAGHFLAGENLQEGRLARAVGADEAVTVARVELEAGALEERLLAEGFS